MEYVGKISFFQKYRFFISYFFVTQYHKPLVLQLSILFDQIIYIELKYQRFTPYGCKDIGTRKFSLNQFFSILNLVSYKKVFKK